MEKIIAIVLLILQLSGSNIEVANYELKDCKFNNGMYQVHERFSKYDHITEIYTNPEIEDATISVFYNSKNLEFEIVDNR